jgi:hypothetical protein
MLLNWEGIGFDEHVADVTSAAEGESAVSPKNLCERLKKRGMDNRVHECMKMHIRAYVWTYVCMYVCMCVCVCIRTAFPLHCRGKSLTNHHALLPLLPLLPLLQVLLPHPHFQTSASQPCLPLTGPCPLTPMHPFSTEVSPCPLLPLLPTLHTLLLAHQLHPKHPSWRQASASPPPSAPPCRPSPRHLQDAPAAAGSTCPMGVLFH